MQLNLKVSEIMESTESRTKEHEHRLIRLPIAIREALKLELDSFLHLKDRKGGTLTLQISEAYASDAELDQFCGYITNENYNRLEIIQHSIAQEYINSGEVYRVNGITLGCDPEVFLVNRKTGGVMAAYRYFNKYGNIGNDGILMEFRPMHSCIPEVVAKNIFDLIQKTRYQLNNKPGGKDIKIVAASAIKGVTAGFHLHYGLPKELLGQNNGVKGNRARLITKALDYYVGLPSIIPEGNHDILRRTTPYMDYGKPGNYRLSCRTFEYRLPGGICMAHPILSIGLLSLGAVVVEDLISRISDYTNEFKDLSELLTEDGLREIYPNLPHTSTMYSLICTPRIEPALAFIDRIKKDIKQMVGYNYKNRSVAIKAFFDCITSNLNFNNDVEQNWRTFYNEKQQRSMVVS